MRTKLKKLMSIILTFIVVLNILPFDKKEVLGASENVEFSIDSVSNGSFIITFNSTRNNVMLSNFVVNYEVNGSQKGQLNLLGINNVGNYRYQLNYSALQAVMNKQEVGITVFYRDNANNTGLKSATYAIPALASEDLKIISNENGNLVVSFEKSRPEPYISDFSATFSVDSVNKGSLPLRNISTVYGYSNRFKISYDPLIANVNAQEIQIDLNYKNIASVSSKYTLYPSGVVSNGTIGSEYDSLKDAPFRIKSIVNGEIGVKFDSELRSTLVARDFYARYYIDGAYYGDLKITGVDEDSILLRTDYTVYFDKLVSKEKMQSVTILLFYDKSYKTKPVKDYFAITADEILYETDVTVDSVKEFTSNITLPTVKIKERGKNTILESSKSRIEYIKLELPDDFEFSNAFCIINGKDGLSPVKEYDVQYGTSKGEQTKNVMLIGFVGSGSERSRIGSLEISELKIKALENANYGEVKLRISGGGISYERVTVANYLESLSNTNTNTGTDPNTNTGTDPNTNTGTDTNTNEPYMVTLIEGIPKLFLNGSAIDMDTKPFIQDGRLMLPVTHIALAFGIPSSSIDWDGIAKTVKINTDTRAVSMEIGSKILLVDGSPIVMDTTATIVDSRTFIPMRYLADALGFATKWNEITRTATLVK